MRTCNARTQHDTTATATPSCHQYATSSVRRDDAHERACGGLRYERLPLPYLPDVDSGTHMHTREPCPITTAYVTHRTHSSTTDSNVYPTPPPPPTSAATTVTTATATTCSQTPAHTSHALLPLERAPHGSWTATATATPTTVVTTHATKTATTYSHSPAHERRQ